MKKERLAALMMAGIMSVSCAGIAMAATGTKTATLNNAKVRFNNGAVQTIQCYNIDGSNYVRARDITNNLNMGVTPIKNGNKGVMINPYDAPASKAVSEELTQQSAKVKVEKGQLIYDGMVAEAECFLLDGRYYFKLADFQKSSDNSLKATLEMTEIQAKGEYVDAPFMDEFPCITVTWDNDTKIINVNKEKTDLVQYFNDIRGNKSSAAKLETGNAAAIKESVKETTKETVKGTGVLTSAPEVGEVLANILIDESEGAYLKNGKANWDNITEPYANAFTGMVGQCTWYAEGRFFEVHGLSASENTFANSNTYIGWITNAQSSKFPDIDGTTDSDAISSGCIAMFDGHALFVEWVDFDDEGNPSKVYFTEANTGHDGVYRPEKDAKVQVLDFDDFITRQKFIGYVMVK